MKYRTIFKALKLQEEIVILQEIQELQDSVPRLQLMLYTIDRNILENWQEKILGS